MKKKGRHKSTVARIETISKLAQQHYEVGRQDRSYKAVWRNYVFPVYKIEYRTFLRYINTPVPKTDSEDGQQMKLF